MNYSAIVLVGSILLERLARLTEPKARNRMRRRLSRVSDIADIGTFWLPVFLVILWQHPPGEPRWPVFGGQLAWFILMFAEAGG